MFRCPCCAKVSKIRLTKGHSLLISKDMDKLWLVKEPIRLAGLNEWIPNDLGVMAHLLETKELELDTQGDNFLECPSCSTWSKFEAWNHAWNFPGDFFNADQLCHCGGELWYDPIPGTNKYGLVCEDCGWVKKGRTISSSPSL